MFNDTKYTRWYYQLVAKPDLIVDYTELHHILPKSLGGSNKRENLVRLSARQHFVAHLLLTKMVDGEAKRKMCWALHKITFSKNKAQSRIFNSAEYELARRLHAANVSKPKSKEHQEKISKALTGKKRTSEQKQRMSLSALKERANNPANPKRLRTPEQQEKINAKLRNVPKTEEHKAKLRGPKTEEHRRKLSLAQTGKVASAETRKKISDKTSGRKCKPRTAEHSAAIWASRREKARMRELQAQSSTPQC